MSTIKKFGEEIESPSNLVVGTEGGNVFVIETITSKITSKFKLPNVPTCMSTYGSFDTDYRIHAACRNEIIYTIRNGEIALNTAIQVSSRVISMHRYERGIYLATFNNYYQSYSVNGKRLFSIKEPAEIFSVESCESRTSRGFKGVLLALKNREIRLYNDKILVNILILPENIMGLKFGRFGKQEDMLVVVSDKGSVYLKVLDKSIHLDTTSYKKPYSVADEGSLNIPKKTTLYLDLMEREKEMFRSKFY